MNATALQGKVHAYMKADRVSHWALWFGAPPWWIWLHI